MKSHAIIAFHFIRESSVAQIHDPLSAVFSRSFFPVPFQNGSDIGKHSSAQRPRRGLRQQLIVWKKENPRPRLSRFDRLFWVMIRMTWRKWQQIIVIVKPETVIKWHRCGFRLFWRFISTFRKPDNIDSKREIRFLIKKLSCENPSWGAPRIHGELLKLGFRVCERTVSRYLPKRRPSKNRQNKWLIFLHNHRHAFAGMDFFTVPTLFFRQLYCFFIIAHDKRTIIHFNVTFHPNAAWVKKQLENAFAKRHAIKYMIYDRDSIFSPLIKTTLKSLGIDAVRTSYQSPWQNGIAERFIGSVRRDLLDHVIIINKTHLYRLMQEYVDYYHNDRTHYALAKETPANRLLQEKPSANARLVALPRLGGLHHRYVWKDAA